MPCQEVSELMSCSLDNCQSAADQQNLNDHLAACESCREEWACMRRMNALLIGAKRVQPPPGFTAHVMARIQERLLWRRIVRNGSLMLVFSLLGAVFLSSLVIMASPVLFPLAQTPFLATIVAIFERSNALILTCGNAFFLILNAAFNSNYPFLIVGYLMVAVVLLIWWTKVLLVPNRKSSIVTQEGSLGG